MEVAYCLRRIGLLMLREGLVDMWPFRIVHVLFTKYTLVLSVDRCIFRDVVTSHSKRKEGTIAYRST